MYTWRAFYGTFFKDLRNIIEFEVVYQQDYKNISGKINKL